MDQQQIMQKDTSNRTLKFHACTHCQTPLKAPASETKFPFRIPFPQNIHQARAAAKDGCIIFEELLQHYSARSWWCLLETHIWRPCSCCSSAMERWKYIFRSLSSTPFQVLFLPERRHRGPGSTFDSFAWLDCGGGSPVGARFNTYTYSGDPAASFFPAFDTRVNTPHTVESVTSWLQSCTCSTFRKKFRPTRLIDIGLSNSTHHIKVIQTDASEVSAYVCLSYCWGGSLPLRCNAENMGPSGVWELPTKDLGKTFTDTIKIVRQLGFRYLWIDSLCIMQDSPSDKNTEIAHMPHIYGNAELTICASSAENPSAGFLEPRPDFSENRLQISMPNGREGTICLDRIFWLFPPVKEPLGTRAWALQERILSPRLLEYGWRSARWTCSCTDQYSGFTMTPVHGYKQDTGFSPAHFNLYGFLNPLGSGRIATSRNELFKCWASIVWRYSSLDLTFRNDKIAAISGVAAVLQERTGVRYLAGLWDYDRLPSLLQWRVRSPPMDLSERPVPGRDPSWSWPAIDDPVEIMQSPIVVDGFKVIEAEESGVFESSSSISISVRGLVRAGIWWCENWAFEAKQPAEPVLTRLIRPDIDLTIFPDCMGEIIAFAHGKLAIMAQELTFLCIGRALRNHEMVRGLILKMANATNYRRVGFFEMRESKNCLVNTWKLETMHII